MKKIISVILVLSMAIGLLTGCGATMDEINKDTNVVVATIGNQNIYAYELIYLMKMGYTKEQALEEFQTIKTLVEKAGENKIELNADDIANVDKQLEDASAQFESKEAFEEDIKNYGLNLDQYKEILKMLALCDKFSAEFENLKLIETTDEETAIAFYNNNFLSAKHILISTVDENQSPLPAEEVTKKKAQAEEIVAKIKAGADFESFYNLSEDPGSKANPEGYTFLNTGSETLKDNEMMISMFQQTGAPIMVPEFEQGTAALAEGEVSGIVESDYGYHIIKRLPLPAEGEEVEQLKSLIIYVVDNVKYNGIVEGWKAELNQKTNKYYEVLEVEPYTPPAQTEAQPEVEVQPEEANTAEAE